MSVSKCPYSFKILTCGTILHFYVALHTLRERISPYRIDTGFDIIFFARHFGLAAAASLLPRTTSLAVLMESAELAALACELGVASELGVEVGLGSWSLAISLWQLGS